MISQTYCIMSITGIGIHGRIVVPGKTGPRFLDLEIYTPHNSRRYRPRLHTEMLEVMFASCADGGEFLKAGSKTRLLRELAKMMFFEYRISEAFEVQDGTGAIERAVTVYQHTQKWHIDPYRWTPADEEEEEGQGAGAGRLRRKRGWNAAQRRRYAEQCQREERVLLGLPPQEKLGKSNCLVRKGVRVAPQSKPLHEEEEEEWPRKRVAVGIEELLCVDLGRQAPVNMGEVRRWEVRERRRREEEEAERRRLAWEKATGRKRGLEVGRGVVVSGFDCVGLVYTFPDAPSTVLLRVYERRTCSYSTIKVNIVHLARTVHAKRHEHWSDSDRRQAFLALLHALQFKQAADPDHPSHLRDTSALWFDTRCGDDVPPLALRPLRFRSGLRHPFQQPPVGDTCNPPRSRLHRDRTFLHRMTSALGGKLSGRAVKAWRPRCRPLRELATSEQGRRMAGGVVRVEGVRCVWSCWWTGAAEGAGGFQLFFLVYVPDALGRSGGVCPACSNHRIAVTFEDVRRVCIGGRLVDEALAAVGEEALAALAKEKQAMAQECDAAALEIRKRLEEADRAAKAGLEGAAEEVRGIREEWTANRSRRLEIEGHEQRVVRRAEEAWDAMSRALLRQCRWVNAELLEGVKSFEGLKGEVLPFAVPQAAPPTLALRCPTLIYQRGHSVHNLSELVFLGRTTVHVIMQVRALICPHHAT
jgi:hypothetical protein